MKKYKEFYFSFFKNHFWFLLILLIVMPIAIYLAKKNCGVEKDAAEYIFTTINIFKGKGFTRFGEFSGVVGPGYGFAVWIISLFIHNFDLSTAILSIMCFFMANCILYYTFFRFYSKSLALAIVMAFALNPIIIDYSYQAMTESFYLFMIFCVFSLVLSFLKSVFSPRKSVLLGFVLGYMYLTRGEAFYFSLLIFTFLLINILFTNKRENYKFYFKYLFIAIVVFTVFAFVNFVNFYLRNGVISVSGMVKAHEGLIAAYNKQGNYSQMLFDNAYLALIYLVTYSYQIIIPFILVCLIYLLAFIGNKKNIYLNKIDWWLVITFCLFFSMISLFIYSCHVTPRYVMHYTPVFSFILIYLSFIMISNVFINYKISIKVFLLYVLIISISFFDLNFAINKLFNVNIGAHYRNNFLRVLKYDNIERSYYEEIGSWINLDYNNKNIKNITIATPQQSLVTLFYVNKAYGDDGKRFSLPNVPLDSLHNYLLQKNIDYFILAPVYLLDDITVMRVLKEDKFINDVSLMQNNKNLLPLYINPSIASFYGLKLKYYNPKRKISIFTL